jgi:hypothetical protein
VGQGRQGARPPGHWAAMARASHRGSRRGAEPPRRDGAARGGRACGTPGRGAAGSGAWDTGTPGSGAAGLGARDTRTPGRRASRGARRGEKGGEQGRRKGRGGEERGRGRGRGRGELTSGSKSGDHRLQNLGHHGERERWRRGGCCAGKLNEGKRDKGRGA